MASIGSSGDYVELPSPTGSVIDKNEKVDAEESEDPKMTAITRWSDVAPFAGHIVAFITDSSYFSGYGTHSLVVNSYAKFAYIHETALPHSVKSRDVESGYCMQRLLNPKGFPSGGAIYDSLLKKKLLMRVAHVEEVKEITKAVQEKKALFELMLDQDRVNAILERALKVSQTKTD